MELIGVFFVGCGLLVLAGIAKAFRPADTARALVLLLSEERAWAPSTTLIRRGVRLGAIAEAMLGVTALVLPRPVPAFLVATSYTLFVLVVLSARRSGGALATCGCFGRPDTPATRLHVFLNLIFAVAAIGVAVHPPASSNLVVFLRNEPWFGLPLVFVSGVGVWLAYLALSRLAALEGARGLLRASAAPVKGS
jgi:hypothetical protein